MHKCVDCGEEGLVFDGVIDGHIGNEYETEPITSEPRGVVCDRKANPEKYEDI